jgi:hypothetical protein
MKTVVRLLKEPSSWRGLALLVTAAGITLKPELQAAIISLGLSIAGLIGVLVPDGGPDGGPE